MSKYVFRSFLLMSTLIGLSGCSKQMDDFVSRVVKTAPLPNIIPFEDDGMNYIRISAGHELTESTSYEATLLLGSPVTQIEGSSVSATIQVNRTTLSQ